MTTYLVHGMSCEHCELSIQEELLELAGVRGARADHTTGRVVVDGTADEAAVRAAVAQAGYELAGTVPAA